MYEEERYRCELVTDAPGIVLRVSKVKEEVKEEGVEQVGVEGVPPRLGVPRGMPRHERGEPGEEKEPEFVAHETVQEGEAELGAAQAPGETDREA